MRKLAPLFALTALLVACPSTSTPQPTPQPAPAPAHTLYQGDWTWVALNVNDSTDYGVGLVSYSFEVTNTAAGPQKGKRVAGGDYDLSGNDQKPLGAAAMGPIATPLDVAFMKEGGSGRALVAVDLDGGTQINKDNKEEFFGYGQVDPDASRRPVAVLLVHEDDSPTYRPMSAPVPILPSSVSGIRIVPSMLSADGTRNLLERARELAKRGGQGVGPVSAALGWAGTK